MSTGNKTPPDSAGSGVDATDAPASGPSRQAALGRTVARGMGFMVLVSLLGKVLSSLAVVVLGFLLSEHDFGLYAIAFGLAGVIQILRDGGLRQIAIQRGPKGFARLAGPVGWLSFACNSLAGLILAAIAPIAALVYQEPQLLGLILLNALVAPLVTFGSMSKARLEVDLRYGAVARINTWNNITRYTGQIFFAALGFGAYAFVIPSVLVAVVDGLMGYAFTRTTFLQEPLRVRVWRPLLSRMRWTIAGTVGHATINRADYVILGYLAAPVLGLYFFAFQIAMQVNTILAFNLQKVLFPALTRFANEPARHRDAALRATRSLALLSSGAGVGLACVFPSMERLIWGGKWAEAAVATQLLSLAFPMRMPLAIHDSVALSKGEFKRWAVFLWYQGIGLVAASIIAGAAFETVTAVTAVITTFYIAVVPVMIAWRLAQFGIPAGASLSAMCMPWFVAVAAGTPVEIVRQTYGPSLRLAPGRLGDAAEVVLYGTVFVLLFAALSRALIPQTTAELLRALPGRPGRIARSLARVPGATTTPAPQGFSSSVVSDTPSQ
ncbi:MAG: oligosaccharide flippase family protein [Phycisphaerales bacterium]